MKIKPDKTIKALVHRAFPAYHGRKIRLEVGTHVNMYDTVWDGGTKNTFVAVPLVAGFEKATRGAESVWWNAEGGKNVEIPQGIAVVEHSIFCGKDVGITIHLNPADATALLPEHEG